MEADTHPAKADIVDIVCVADFLNRSLVGRNGLDHRHFAAQRDAMWTAPTLAAAEAYVAWHSAYYSMITSERRWLAQAVSTDLHGHL